MATVAALLIFSVPLRSFPLINLYLNMLRLHHMLRPNDFSPASRLLSFVHPSTCYSRMNPNAGFSFCYWQVTCYYIILAGKFAIDVNCVEIVNNRITIKDRETGDSMKPKIIIAVILIALGIAALAYQGITYTTREKVVDLGPIQMTAEKTKTIPLPPILGAIALVGGIVLLVVGSRKD
jgi:hypothetical protein